jgi:hypothetical protein
MATLIYAFLVNFKLISHILPQAVTDDPFHGYQGNDLLNWTTARPSVYRVKKESSVRDMEEMIADNMVSLRYILTIRYRSIS